MKKKKEEEEKEELIIGQPYKPAKYSRLINVDQSRLNYLKKVNELEYTEYGGSWFVTHSEKNTKLLDSPAHNAKRKKS